MSGENQGNKETRAREDMYSSPDSSFEVLDPHDPTLSRLATQMFKRLNEYLQEQISSGADHYTLLEHINRLVITKYTDLRSLSENLNKTLTQYNAIYATSIQPLLSEIDQLHDIVVQLEENAYRLDNYTKKLKARMKENESK